MEVDRLDWVRIEGFRSVERLQFELSGLQVLIGENGSGKSTLLEAFELLRLASEPGPFTREVVRRHGSLGQLKRFQSPELCLTAHVTLASGEQLTYSVALAETSDPSIAVISREQLTSDSRLELFNRKGDEVTVLGSKSELKPVRLSAETALSSLWGATGPEEAQRVVGVLRRLAVHTPFETRALWARPESREPLPSPRVPAQLGSGDHFERGASNLASVFQKLKNTRRLFDWPRVLEDVKAGLGSDILDVSVESRFGGVGELKLDLSGGSIPASQLSSGQLCYLSFVALLHLDDDDTALLFDEPELHLHPGLLTRTAWLFQRMARRRPVVLCTHSLPLLDALDEPEEVVRVLRLDGSRRTELRRLDRGGLDYWKAQYARWTDALRDGLESEIVMPKVAE